MNPSIIQLQCIEHTDQAVTMIDQSTQIKGHSRALCGNCIQEVTQKRIKFPLDQSELQLITIQNFIEKANQYEKQQTTFVKKKYEEEKTLLKGINKLFSTLKEEIEKIIQIIVQTLINLNDNQAEELQNLKDLSKIMSYQRLLQVADMLADQNKQTTINKISQEVGELILRLTQNIQDKCETINKNLSFLSISKFPHDACQTLQKYIDVKNIQEQNPQNNPRLNQEVQEIRPYRLEKAGEQISYVISQPIQQWDNHLPQSIQASNQIDIQPKNPPLSKSVPEQYQMAKKNSIQVEQESECQWECQILVSNAKQQIIVGGARCILMIWEQEQKQIVKNQIAAGHLDLVTGIAIFNSRKTIISGGYDGQLIVWEKNEKNQWAQILQEQNQKQIIGLMLTPQESQVILSCENSTIKCYSIKHKLTLVQELNLNQSVNSICVNPIGEYLGLGCKEKVLKIYDLQESNWYYQFQLETEGEISQLYFTEDNELVCQQCKPPILIIYYILDNQYEVAQTIKLNVNSTIECFPIFKVDQMFCCKFGQNLFLFKKQGSGQYNIWREINGTYEAACFDSTGTRIILKDRFKKYIQICSFN